jgi:hypothetical protein
MKYDDMLAKFPISPSANTRFIIPQSSDNAEDILTGSLSNETFEDARIMFNLLVGKIPSARYSDPVHSTNFEELLKFLLENNFKMLYQHRNNYDAYTYDVIVFMQHEREFMVKCLLNHNKPITARVTTSLFEDPEESNVENNDMANAVNCIFSTTEQNLEFFSKMNDIMEHRILLKPKNCIFLFEKNAQGQFRLEEHEVKGFDIDIDKHYNDDFRAINDDIIQWVGDFSVNNQRLIMLEGLAGAGKTNYIRHLLSVAPEVRKIYVPPHYIEAIGDPSFLSFIKKYKNSLLILEDSEKVLVKRDIDTNNNGISVLLNMTDGILGSVLNFKVACTFNTDQHSIDPALMRKGRLHLKYHFDKLSKEKTRMLFQELYDSEPPVPEMTLGEIYNTDDNGIKKKEERKIGF